MSKKKGKKQQAEEDDSTRLLLKRYMSKLSVGIAQNKTFRSAIDQALENQEHLRKVHIVEEIGPNATKVICDSLIEIKYKHLTDIWFVKGGLGDEGARYISAFLETAGKEVAKYNESKKKEKDRYHFIINLTENELTSVGCQSIGRAISPIFQLPLKELVLDFNPFSWEGMEQLAQGLILNSKIQKLSLNFCCLELESVRYLQQILSYIDSDLRYLYLEGNFLRNEGVYQLFRALEANEWLEELNIANNQFGECEDIPVVEKICEVLTKNNSLQVYDLRGNAIYDDCNRYNKNIFFLIAIRKFLECIKMYKTVCKFEVPFLIQKELLEELKKTLKKRKRKKKKRKAKSKKNKKKKKK